MKTKPGRNAPCPCGSGSKYKFCCLPLVEGHQGPAVIGRGASRILLGVDLWEPSATARLMLREEARAHLLEAFPAGRYRDSTAILEIIDRMFAFYNDVVYSGLRKTCSLSALTFLLEQLDRWSEVYYQWRFLPTSLPILSQEDRDEIPVMRRALKHTVEVLAGLSPSVDGPKVEAPGALECIERVHIAAKLMVMLSGLRDRTHKLFPNNSIATISAGPSETYLDIELDDDARTLQDLHQETQYRFLQLSNADYDDVGKGLSASEFCDYFKVPFESSLGASADAVVRALKTLRDERLSQMGRIPLVRRARVIGILAVVLDAPRDVSERIVDLFTLRPDSFASESPDLWRIKRDHRISRKPLIWLNHGSEDFLSWCPYMISEALLSLYADLPRRKIPPEMRKYPDIRNAAEVLHRRLNHDFEIEVFNQLWKRGFRGRSNVESGSLRLPNGQKLRFPSEVGEIDLLMLHPQQRILLVGECKNTSFAPEPSQWYEDIEDFIKGSGSRRPFKARFIPKAAWAGANAAAIITAICHEVGLSPAGEWRVENVLVTHYPSIVTHMITEFPCLSVFDLLDRYDQSGTWPEFPTSAPRLSVKM